MVKRTLASCLLAALILFLCISCEKSVNEQTDSREVSDGTGETELRIIANDESGYTKYGIYRYFLWQADYLNGEGDANNYFEANIALLDPSSQTFTYLCAVPGCSHNSENCTSYVKATGMLMFFSSYDENSLYLVSMSSLFSAETEEEQACIIRCDPDGNNRKEICRLPSNMCFVEYSFCAQSDRYLFAMLWEYDKDSEEFCRRLYRFDLETGEYSLLLDVGEEDYIQTVNQNKILITHVEDELEETGPMEPLRYKESQCFYNVDTGGERRTLRKNGI